MGEKDQSCMMQVSQVLPAWPWKFASPAALSRFSSLLAFPGRSASSQGLPTALLDPADRSPPQSNADARQALQALSPLRHTESHFLLQIICVLLCIAWSTPALAASCANQARAYSGCMTAAAEASDLDTAFNPTGKVMCNLSNPLLDGEQYGEYLCGYEIVFSGQKRWSSCGAVGRPSYHQWAGVCPVGSTWDSSSKACTSPLIPAENLGTVCGTMCGNPINVATGNKYQQEVDFIGQHGLVLVRHYNSDASAAASGFGPHWTHTFSARIEVVGAQEVNVRRPTGETINFREEGGQWKAKANVPSTLTRLVDAAGNLLGWDFAQSDQREMEAYDAQGRLTAIRRADGYAVELSYTDGRLAHVQTTDGRRLTFNYSASGRISKVTDPAGVAFDYAYGATGQLEMVTLGGRVVRDYVFNEAVNTGGANLPNALTGIVDETGQRFATFKYAPDGRGVSTEHAGGVERVSIQYNDDGSVDVTTPLGSVQNRAFATILGIRTLTSLVETCAGCTSSSKSYLFTPEGWPDLITDGGGGVTNRDYDTKGRLTQQVEAVNNSAGSKRTTQTDWHPSFRVPTERRTYDAASALIGKQTWTYNARGQRLTSTSIDPASSSTRSTTMSYCEQANIDAGTCPRLGLVTSINGPRTDVNDVTTYIYYPSDAATCASAPATCPHRKGDLWMVQDAAGNITETLKYDGAGRVLSVKDANGVVTDFEHHPRGWLTARKVRGADNASEADDQITRIAYYPTGLVQKTTLPDGSFTSYTYDAAHRLTDITDGEGNKIHYTLDNAGNRTKEETLGTDGAVLRTLSRVYNQIGQLKTHKDAYDHGTGYIYDASGNMDTVTDALGRVSDNDYDPLNRLTRTIQDVGGLNVTTQFKYNAQDNLTEVIDPKHLSTRYTYDGLGDLKKLESPDTGTTSYTYDSAGNRKTQTDARGVTATYGYDALNRLASVSYPDNSLNVGYSYDTAATACASGETFAAGRLSRMTDGSGNTQYCYDRFGHMVRKVQTTAGQSLTVRYGYTKAGQLSSVTYPDGTVADYVRDGLGRTTEIGVTRPGGSRQILLTSASYYPFGPASEWVFGNGRLFQRTLNQNYQPGVVQDQSAGGLSLGYEFDAVGNLVKLRNGDQSEPPLRRYVYDALNRLTEARDGATDALLQGYGYDATGNRISTTDGGVVKGYTLAANSHRLTDVGGVARTYDNAGNTVSIGETARQFVYSDANRLSAVKEGASSR